MCDGCGALPVVLGHLHGLVDSVVDSFCDGFCTPDYESTALMFLQTAIHNMLEVHV